MAMAYGYSLDVILILDCNLTDRPTDQPSTSCLIKKNSCAIPHALIKVYQLSGLQKYTRRRSKKAVAIATQMNSSINLI